MPTRWLIVNADDFGLSPGVTQGILRAHQRGIVTSTSLMVRAANAADAALLAPAHPALSVGLHVDLAEWVFRNGEWMPLYRVVDTDDPRAVELEVRHQLETFRRLTGRAPTHLDSHQHAHRNEPVRSVLLNLARELGVPLRGCDPRVNYCGMFYGQTGEGLPYPEGISLDGLLNTLRTLPPGLTELACHPGEAEDLDSVYRAERPRELEVLCAPEARATLDELGIELCSFADVPQIKRELPTK